ncbi:MAG: glycosyltransferase [Promethearchaeota archaeon]
MKTIKKKKVIFCTGSNFKDGNSGDAVNDHKLFDCISNDGYEKIVIYPKYNSFGSLNLISLLIFFFKYLKNLIGFEKIIITRALKLALLPVLLKNFFKTKIIVRMGCSPFVFIERQAFLKNKEYKKTTNLLKKIFFFIEPHLELYIAKKVDKFIIENEKAKKIAQFYDIPSEKIVLIPYYVEEYFYSTKILSFNKDKDVFLIGYTGRFSQYDLLKPVIDAIFILKEKKKKIKLFLIGDGITRKNIEHYVKEKNLLENVFFWGKKSHKEMSSLIDNFHCLLLPMFKYIHPSALAIKILEGVIKGKIIITTNSGNNVSLFNGHNDLIIEKLTVNILVDKIESVINNYNYYANIAKDLSMFHKKIRSKEIYKQKINNLIEQL